MLADKLSKVVENQIAPEILVIGDLMLDHYIFGSANRLSPEAPVPVVSVDKETKIVGGAANVASNLIELGANVYLAGVVGDDTLGVETKLLLNQKGVNTSLIISDADRKTTVKTRIIAGTHQIVRVDSEDIHSIKPETEDILFDRMRRQIDLVSIVVLSDYNKGLLTPSLSQKIITYCTSQKVKVIVDPKGLDYNKYRGAFIIKPNRKELAEAAQRERITTAEELLQAANIVLQNTGADYLVVTLSESGIAVISAESHRLIPVAATEVYDVTGAGDTVIATLAYCLSQGFNIEEAAIVANHAASIVIKHIGSATTTIPVILNSLNK